MKIVNTLKDSSSMKRIAKRDHQSKASTKKKKVRVGPPKVTASNLKQRIQQELEKRNKLNGPKASGPMANSKEIMSGSGLNNPNDPSTQHKLKAALDSGMVQWSDKDREVLKSILEK